jgi:uncharacterized integral membrane protein (TIGR00698 family)
VTLTSDRTAPSDIVAPAARSVGPGLLVAAIGGAAALAVNAALPLVSATLAAIVLGFVVASLGGTREAMRPGLHVASRRILRVGVALLGLQLALADILGIGWPILLVVVAVVSLGIIGTLGIARLLGVPGETAVLVAAGFSICGAAAVAAVQGVRRSRDEAVGTAVSLVVVFGSVAMIAVPLLALALGMDEVAAGAWSGASIHEVGQVVVAGGLVGGAALQVAVAVKLGRVLLLAPVLAVMSWHSRQHATDGHRPPLVPLFVAVFVGCVALRSFVPLPEVALDIANGVQAAALAMAMFALGALLNVRVLRAAGAPVLGLAAAATLLVALLALPAAFLA